MDKKDLAKLSPKDAIDYIAKNDLDGIIRVFGEDSYKPMVDTLNRQFNKFGLELSLKEIKEEL